MRSLGLEPRTLRGGDDEADAEAAIVDLARRMVSTGDERP